MSRKSSKPVMGKLFYFRYMLWILVSMLPGKGHKLMNALSGQILFLHR